MINKDQVAYTAPQLSNRPITLNLALAPTLILTLLALTLALTNPLSPNWLHR